MKQERSKWQRTQVAPAICQQGSEALTPEAPEVLDASNTRGMSLEVNPLSAELSDETAGSPATSQPVRDSEQRSQGSYAWIPDPWKLRAGSGYPGSQGHRDHVRKTLECSQG